MSLREQLFQQADGTLPQRVAQMNGASVPASPAYQQAAMGVHQIIIDRTELGRLQQLVPDQTKREPAQPMEHIVGKDKHQLNEAERRRLVNDVQNEMLGYGPLEMLLADPTVSDILVNMYKHVYVEWRGKLELISVTFLDDARLMRVIKEMASRVGHRIDESSPMVDARPPDGSRINTIIPPPAIDGPLLSIRRFAVNPLAIDDLVSFNTLTPAMAQLIDAMAKAKLNILISGGTSNGKTTLLNTLSGYTPPGERIVAIEDAAELQLRQNHVLCLEIRLANIEGRGETTQRALVKNALCTCPDRTILGEICGAEALDILHAMNTGHEGSPATIHASIPCDALTCLESMISMAGMQLSPRTMWQQITSAFTVVLQVSRLIDGFCRLTSVQEITGMEGEVVNMQEIFAFRRKGIDQYGHIHGHFCAADVRPKFSECLKIFGIQLPKTFYDPVVLHEI